MRLDDFWGLRLCRPSREHLMRKCKYLIRRHKFHELAKESPMRALTFLQTDLAATVDHNDIEETTEFQLLASTLFKDHDEDQEMADPDMGENFLQRSTLFDTLVSFFPEDMTQPKGNLIDLIML